MTNKEIAVRLYCVKFRTFAGIMHQERQKKDKWATLIPSTQEMIDEIKQIKEILDTEFPEN